MADTNCDGCGETPYLGLATGNHEYEIEMWCECGDNVPVELIGTSGKQEKPDFWGGSGSRFICYQCGEIPEMRASISRTGRKSRVNHYVTCGCDAMKVGVGWRGLLLDKWKDDMDITKWPDVEDEIMSIVEEHGPVSSSEVAEHIDLPVVGVECIMMHIARNDDLFRSYEDGYMTMDQLLDGQYDVDRNGHVEKIKRSSDDGNGLIRSILGL